MAVLARPRWILPILVAAIAVHGAGCADGGEPRVPDEADDDAAADPASPTADTVGGAAPAAVSLPANIPADFPIPPQSTISSADALTDDDGTLTNVTILSEGDPEAGYAWYRDALTQAGWTVTAEAHSDGTRSLHADKGESYVDLTVVGDPSGRTRAGAAIWKINP
ncbi:MAG TPA: hypothetical protein VM778_03570 [Gemmatimonadota bacterium]|nr:hypothetical protein [Gemmatimonadota bacterium]